MDYFSHLQAYTLPYTLNCICVCLFTIIVSLCNKIEHNNMNFLFSFCIKDNCKLQLTVSGSGGLLAAFHIELAPVRGLLTVWSPWGNPGIGQVSEKECIGHWIHPTAQSTLGELQWDKQVRWGAQRSGSPGQLHFYEFTIFALNMKRACRGFFQVFFSPSLRKETLFLHFLAPFSSSAHPLLLSVSFYLSQLSTLVDHMEECECTFRGQEI